MGLPKTLLIFCTSALVACSKAPPPTPSFEKRTPSSFSTKSLLKTDPRQVLFLLHKGELAQALDLAIELKRVDSDFSYETLQKLAEYLILHPDKNNTEALINALYGAKLSQNTSLLSPLLKAALSASNPNLQLIGLQTYATDPDDQTSSLLSDALGSPYLGVRLEAAYTLALKKAPDATAQILSLMHKSPPEIEPLFPSLFALEGSSDSFSILQQLLSSANIETRTQAVLAAGQYQRDDLLNDIYPIASHRSYLELEATSWVLGSFKDLSALPILKANLNSDYPSVKLASAWALNELGEEIGSKVISSFALEGECFSIVSLKDKENSKPILEELLKHPSKQVQLNAAFALLHHRDPKALEILKPYLLPTAKGEGFRYMYSLAGVFYYLSPVSSAEDLWEKEPEKLQQLLVTRALILQMANELPEADFLPLAKDLLKSGDNSLIPLLMELLKSRVTPNVIAMLKEVQVLYTSRFVRQYCNLTLMELQEEGPYEEELKAWMQDVRFHPVIQFSPPMVTTGHTQFIQEVTPTEKSQLLISAYLAFAKRQKPEDIVLLLQAIRYGAPENRPILAGILLQATE